MTSAERGGRVSQILTKSKGGCVNLVRTRMEEVQNPENLADVINGLPPSVS